MYLLNAVLCAIAISHHTGKTDLLGVHITD